MGWRLYRRKKSPLWYVDLSAGGRRARKSTGESDRQLAERVAAKLWAEWVPPLAPATKGALTVEEAANRMLGDPHRRRKHPTTERDLARFIAALPPEMLRLPIESSLQAWRSYLGAMTRKDGRPLAPQTLRNRTNYARLILSYARDLGAEVVPSSLQTHKAFTIGTRRAGVPKEDLRALWRTVDDYHDYRLGLVYRLAFYAGLRRGEIAALLWSHVDLRHGTLLAPGSKSARSYQRVPLQSSLAEALRHARDRHGAEGHVVPVWDRWGNPTDTPMTGPTLGHLVRRAKLSGLELPDLHRGRHTLAVSLLEAGVSIEQVSQLLRHSSIAVTQRFYGWSAVLDVAEAVDRISY